MIEKRRREIREYSMQIRRPCGGWMKEICEKKTKDEAAAAVTRIRLVMKQMFVYTSQKQSQEDTHKVGPNRYGNE